MTTIEETAERKVDEEATHQAVEAGLDTVMFKTSLRETAERIVREWVSSLDEGVAKPAGSITRLTNAIEFALLAERERAAKIASVDIATAIRSDEE